MGTRRRRAGWLDQMRKKWGVKFAYGIRRFCFVSHSHNCLSNGEESGGDNPKWRHTYTIGRSFDAHLLFSFMRHISRPEVNIFGETKHVECFRWKRRSVCCSGGTSTTQYRYVFESQSGIEGFCRSPAKRFQIPTKQSDRSSCNKDL